MKKNIIVTLLSGFALLIVGALILSSCEGPMGPAGAAGSDGADGPTGAAGPSGAAGPAGPAGADGANGIDGIDGIDGVDFTSTCVLCHSDDQTIVTKSRQHANSAHSTGHTSGYTNRSFGPAYNCAACHTSQGFLDNLVGASNVPYANVTQPNCYTCHSIHDTYTADDWGLTQTTFVDPLTGSTGVDLGSGNQCTSCHQMVGSYLATDSLWANFDDGGLTTVEITAGLKRAGVHHAPQYNLLVGMDLFEFSGTENMPTSAHVSDMAADGCVTCHMEDGFGDLTGHSMAVMYEFHGSENSHWPASCLACHVPDGGNDLDDKYAAIKLATDALLAQLYDILVADLVMYPVDDDDEYLMMPGTFTTAQTAAHLNYNAIREDKSHGFHNPGYVEAVLSNSIEALTP